MSSRNKRRQHDDPLASDPEDLDYGAASPPRPQTRRSKTSKAPSRKPNKRQRRTYRDSEGSDIVDDDEDSSEESSKSDSVEDSEEEIQVNPRTGRGVRSAAKKLVKYEESSDEEDIGREQSPEETEPSPRKNQNRPSLIVKLKLPPSVLAEYTSSMRTRRDSRSTRRGTTPELARTRRSSRLSHDEQEPMYALTDSGRHTQIVRPGTRSPEPQMARQTRGGKGPKKIPSAIMEASQEISDPSRTEGIGEIKHDTDHEDALGEEEEVRPQVPSSDAGTPARSETQADPQPSEDVKMSEGVVQESIHEDDDDDDDIPITRSGRNLRVGTPCIHCVSTPHTDIHLVARSRHYRSPSHEKFPEAPKAGRRREQRLRTEC